MHRALIAPFFGFALAACAGEGSEIEIVRVSDHLTAGESYTIDLTREDAIFVVAPGLNTEHLAVLCPTLARLDFDRYVEARIRPTGSTYDPAKNDLWLANGLMPAETIDTEIRGLASSQAACMTICSDSPDGSETCQERCVGQAAE